MQVNFVTRRGTSKFHGRVYDDFRNTALNADSWLNDSLTAIEPVTAQTQESPDPERLWRQLGGPILKDKLFFFGSFSMSKQPGGFSAQQWVSRRLLQGNFTYVDSNGNTQVVNVLQVAGKAGLPSGEIPTSATLHGG